jgi:phosphoenolpyruvate carboxylase
MIKRDLYYERIPTKSLRDDVRLLGNILGNVIKKQEGLPFFNLVEKIRKLSKANRANIRQKDSYKKISKSLSQISPSNTYKLTRAFSHFMNLF